MDRSGNRIAKKVRKPRLASDEVLRLKRQLQVEAALEKVRERTLRWTSSDELADTSALLFQQLKALGIDTLRTSLGIFDEPNEAIELWLTTTSGKAGVVKILDYVNVHIHPLFENQFRTRQRGKTYALTTLKGKAVQDYYQNMSSYLTLPKQKKYNTEEHFYSFFFTQGAINITVKHTLAPEERRIMERFAAVFGLIYTRFLDLQKAEAQAREAQVELALERVRKRTMAMNKSDELTEVAGLLYGELHRLGLTEFINCGYVEVDEATRVQHTWMTDAKGSGTSMVLLPLTGDPVFDERYEAWKRKDKLFHQSVGGTLLKEHIEYGTQHYRDSELDQMVRTQFPDPTIFYCSNFQHGYLHMITRTPLTEEAETLLIRFTGAFELTYTRFLDLKKAEAQAREAQIETSLERVRAKAMAMHNSGDLEVAAGTVFTELKKLGINPIRSGFVLLTKESRRAKLFPATVFDEKAAQSFTGEFEFVGHPIFEKQYESWMKGENYFPELEGEIMKSYYRILSEGLKVPLGTFRTDKRQFGSFLPFSEGFLFTWSELPYSEHEITVLGRFRTILDLTTRRYLDIRRAEAQAHEAQIEAALERVRSRSMGMHKSEELADVISIVSAQMQSLQIRFDHVSFVIKSGDEDYHFWTALYGKSRPYELRVPYLDNPIANKTKEARNKGLTFFADTLSPAENREWLEHAFRHNPSDYLSSDEKAYALTRGFARSIAIMPTIMLAVGTYTSKPYSDSENEIIKRFAAVFEQSYTRFLDLVRVEAQARQAVKRAALDRVRAEIAAMRTTTDLQRITPLVWRELKTLGVPFFRCGVLIVDEQTRKVNYYLSTPEGKPLAVMHLDFETELTVVTKAVDHWRRQETYIDHWTRDEFLAFAQAMIKLGQVETIKSYQGGEQAPESLTLQFVPFSQGMLYVGSAESLTAEQIELVHALADAFSTAYARYEDFVRLELAKEQVETTLRDLQSTQNQLIQSEKMASLGELTAGIAHEIQNPLNFVNNFSEVSKELLGEMGEELAQGNAEGAREIAQSVVANLDKISFHGKRADGIVKSMLQHSRKSSGQKELTDINALCDEYLRLAYHGLRAKDKSFNAKFDLLLDPAVGKISVMPQEIGRVILNLINNAFHTVTEKKNQNPQGYEPTVTISSRKSNGTIEIRVIDNGNGIPEHIKDKIFQPFFTTKPTGQGTGLGLSLSYDIVKAHEGELTVETKKDEGSSFTIRLPISH